MKIDDLASRIYVAMTETIPMYRRDKIAVAAIEDEEKHYPSSTKTYREIKQDLMAESVERRQGRPIGTE